MVYTSFLKNLAFWGFIVIDSNSTMTQTGDDLVSGIDYLIEQNETENSIFYGKVDTEHNGAYELYRKWR